MTAPAPIAELRDHTVAGEATEGAGVVSGWADVVSGFADAETTTVGHGANLAAAGLDTLDVVMNPLGGLAGAGVGWLIEHVWWLHEPLDALAGDPIQIEDQARVWESVAERLSWVAQGVRDTSGETTHWQGIAGDAYRGAAGAYAQALDIGAGCAGQAAGQILESGVLVATVRSLVRDTIAEWVGNIVGAAVAAGIAAVFTFGGSLAVWVAWVVKSAATTAGEIAQTIATLVGKLGERAGKLAKLVGRFEDLSAGLARCADGLTKHFDRGLEFAGRIDGIGGHLPDGALARRLDDLHRVPPPHVRHRHVGVTTEEIVEGGARFAGPAVELVKQHESDDWRPQWQRTIEELGR